MKYILPVFSLLLLGCVEKKQPIVNVVYGQQEVEKPIKSKSAMDEYYANKNQDTIPSKSIGSVHKGIIQNSSLFPPSGDNFKYFSETSYLKGRAFVHSTVKEITLNTFSKLKSVLPERVFQVMEIAHEHGGELWPHQTHQKGTSVDFMLPKTKDDEPNYSLDNQGVNHYFLTTNNQGVYDKSGGVIVDFETTAKMILQLQKEAKKVGWKIKKVILKIELKDELFATSTGKKLKANGIYFAKSLSKKVNAVHDDHFHVDFEEIKI